ncbi:MAG: protein translocase subunit SecF [bacterium]
MLKLDLKMIDFMAMRKVALIVSLVLIVVSVLSLAIRGLNLGLDFTGGTVLTASYPESVDTQHIREVLAEKNFDASVQNFGSSKEVLIRLAPQEGKKESRIVEEVTAILKADNAGFVAGQSRRLGAQIGEELRDDGGLAMLYALVGILIYVAFRFELRFSAGAIAALVHDVVITLGFFSVTGIEFDLTVLAAILAIIGYSLNDTIVVFDRIRENFLIHLKKTPEEVVNLSINNTLARTLVTSLTTLLVLLALYFFGGEVMSAFALALIVGVIVGTYSSIYVASSSLLMLGVTKESLLPPDPEEDEELSKIP